MKLSKISFTILLTTIIYFPNIFGAKPPIPSTTSAKTTVVAKTGKAIVRAPRTKIYRKKTEFEKFAAEQFRKRILDEFARTGRKYDNIQTMLSTFDAVQAKISITGVLINLSEAYKNWETKLVEKVSEDEENYDLDEYQLKRISKHHKGFNNFIEQAIAAVVTRETKK
jgi:hypothetical protein